MGFKESDAVNYSKSGKSATLKIVGEERALLRTELVHKTSLGVLVWGVRKKIKPKWLNLTLRNSKSGSLDILQSNRLFHLTRWSQVDFFSSDLHKHRVQQIVWVISKRTLHRLDLALGVSDRQLRVSVCSRLEGPVTYSTLRSFLDRHVTSFVIGRFAAPRWSATWWRQ